MRFILSIIVLIGVAAFLRFIVVIIPSSGLFKSVEPKLVAQCRAIEIAPGTEDIDIDHDNGQAFISAADRRAWYAGEAGRPRGGIYMLDLNDANASPRLVSPSNPADFFPHGISLWKGEDGKRRLFVVSHPSSGQEVVEIFDVARNGNLTHVQTASFLAMHSPNDVVAVGASQFYATNDKRYEGGFKSLLESYLALPFTDIVFFDGTEGYQVKRGLTYANGINVSPDGSTIYVAEVLGRRVRAIERDLHTNDLGKSRRFAIPTGPDNIDMGSDGALYVGGHPKILDFVSHAEKPSHISPSEVIRIDPATGKHETVFMSSKGEINGSSVGAFWNGTLLVGAVFESHIMMCPPSPEVAE